MPIRIEVTGRSGHGRVRALIGGLICTALAAVGAVAALSPDAPLGGIPLLPAAWNSAIGRMVFGFGSLLCAAMALWAFVEAWRGPHGRARNGGHDGADTRFVSRN